MMEELFAIGPNGTVHLLGIKLAGFNAANASKLLVSLVFLMGALTLGWLARRVAAFLLRDQRNVRVSFWTRQAISLGVAVAILIGVVSIWFDDPTRLATGLGLVTAGLAFALQKVVTSIAGYFVILRGKTFNVGDRIVMGGVRGDVVALGFMQTSIMEMGQPPGVQNAEPAMWVKSRQYTGRIVTVPNSKIFDEPVYNYTRDFDYIWEEMSIPVAYTADRAAAESVIRQTAQKHNLEVSTLSDSEREELRRRYDVLDPPDFSPRTYWRLTDNWLEITVRFLTRAHGVREVKDEMSREILTGLEAAGIEIASATFEVTGLPELRLESSTRRSLGVEKH